MYDAKNRVKKYKLYKSGQIIVIVMVKIKFFTSIHSDNLM